ncbi:MAG: hypothetical protein JNG89_10365 [Planctomycetaceae bacterium]|nr:hypothetical protein [Planctomycetaceae bacterium]
MMTASDGHRFPAIGRRPEPVDGAELLRLGLIGALSIAAALAVGWLTLRTQPLHDPIDVVGLPLIRGYSEATEQFALVAAAATVIAVAFLLDRVAPARLPIPEGIAWALVTMGGVAFVALVSRNRVMFPAYALAIGIAHAAGRRAGPNVKPSPAGLGVALVAQFALGRPWRDLAVDLRTIGSPEVLLTFTILSLLVAYMARRRWTEFRSMYDRLAGLAADFLAHRPGTILIATLLWLVLSCTATDCLLISAFAASAVLGARRNSFHPPNAPSDRTNVVWLGLLLLAPFSGPFISTACDFGQVGIHQLLTQLGLGLALAALVQRTMVQHDWHPGRETQSGSWRDNWWSVLPVVFVLLALGRNLWTGLCLLAIVLLLLTRRPRWKPGLRIGALLAFALLFACCPDISSADRPDRFHDGQIMSALFELQHDRLLYSEVFPLRTFHLAVAAIGQWFLPPTLEGFHATQHLVMYLHVGGAAFLVYAWTRSGAWSLLAGLLFLLYVMHTVSTIDLGSRHATHLWLAGLALEILRHRGWQRAVLTGLLGILAAIVGYDGFIPVIAAVAPAIAISDPQVADGLRFWKRRVTNSLLTEGVLIAAPTIVLAVWQSPQSAADYWTLFIDSARRMSAHYGQPLTSEAIRHMAPCFLALALWSVVGVVRWTRLSLFQRAGGLALLIDFLLVLLRGTGRGGAVNYEAGDLPFQIMLVIGAFEGLSAIRRWTGRAMWNDRTLVALAVSAVLVVRLPTVLSDPLTLARQLRSLSPVELLRVPLADKSLMATTGHPHQSAFDPDAALVRNVVGPDESFWAVEDALANYLCERRNPTRHAMAYTICSPAEQRRAIRDLQRDPPKLVTFRPFPIDDIPFSLRYYILSQYLFAHYQPSDHPGFLEPRRKGWTGYDRFPEEWTYPLPLERLAARWGAERLPNLTVRRSERLAFSRLDSTPASGPAADAATWQCDIDVDPSQYDYLVIRWPADSSNPASTKSEGQLAFASPGEDWDAASQLTWTMQSGDHTFLLPVGCSPGWAWRQSIARLRLVLPVSSGDAAPAAELIQIDELDMATSSGSSLR